MYFEIYRSDGWRWRLRAANHKIVAQGESYRNRDDCLNAIVLLRSTTPATPINEVTG